MSKTYKVTFAWEEPTIDLFLVGLGQHTKRETRFLKADSYQEASRKAEKLVPILSSARVEDIEEVSDE